MKKGGNSIKIQFIGATHEVTGSCTLLEVCGKKYLVDCGMEQGIDVFENVPIPVPAGSIEAVFLTHAHIDHTDPQTVQMLLGRQPRLMFAGPPSSHAVLKDCPCFFELFEGAKVTLGAFAIRALPAIHSDRYALGYEIVHEGKTLYFSGDTALLCDLAARVPHQPDAAFLCFNAGVGKNMNAQDAGMRLM